jgi:hypothetical protein
MADKIKTIETWAGCTLSPEYLELLNKAGGKFIGESILIYGPDEVIERNETFESKEYCPGFLAIGDDSGGQAFIIALGKNSSPVFAVDHGSMQPEDFVEVSPNIGHWVRDSDHQR